MATKQWRLDVTEIGSNASLFAVAVAADNWMVALRKARTAIGQPGGVPTGSSCAVAPDGKVTILDPVDRRRFVLTPSTAEGFQPVPVASVPPASIPAPVAPTPVAPKPAPAEAPKFSSWPPAPSAPPAPQPGSVSAPPAPQPGSVSVPAAPQPAVGKSPSVPAPHPYAAPMATAKPKVNFKKTMAYQAPAPAPAATQKKKNPKRTMAYMPAMDIEALKAQAQLENAQEAKESAAKTAAIAAAKAAEAKAAAEEAAKRAQAAAEKAALEAKAQAKAAQEAQKKAAAKVAEANAAQAKAAQTKATQDAQAKSDGKKLPVPAAGLIPKVIPKSTSTAAKGFEAELLFERNADPTEANPLRYRERIFLVPKGFPKDQAEAVARARLAELQVSLSAAPAGKFVNLAVFDHRWEGQPTQPPIVTLQWKDWSGDPVISFPEAAPHAAGQAQLATATPTQNTESPAVENPAPVDPAPVDPAPPVDPALAGAEDDDLAIAEPDAPAQQRFPTSDQDARLTHAFEASQDLLFLETPADGMEFVVKLLEELIASEAANAYIYDINNDLLRFLNCTGPGHSGRHGQACPSRSGIIGVGVARAGKALVVDKVGNHSAFDPKHPEFVGLTPRSTLVVAVECNGQLHGALQLVNRGGDQKSGTFVQSDADLLTFVAGQLGQFLQQCRSKIVG